MNLGLSAQSLQAASAPLAAAGSRSPRTRIGGAATVQAISPAAAARWCRPSRCSILFADPTPATTEDGHRGRVGFPLTSRKGRCRPLPVKRPALPGFGHFTRDCQLSFALTTCGPCVPLSTPENSAALRGRCDGLLVSALPQWALLVHSRYRMVEPSKGRAASPLRNGPVGPVEAH